MPFPIEQKLVIAVSSSALFDLSESDEVFRKQGTVAYKAFQERNLDVVLDKGVAFSFIRKLLSINDHFPDRTPIEVVLLSRNSASTGKRVFRSIRHYGLGITRAAFMSGHSPYEYIPSFNASLFLSANEPDVIKAVEAGYPAGTVLPSSVIDDPDDPELRIAFDFDGVIADDEAESVFQQHTLDSFHEHEETHVDRPHNPGPLADLFQKLAYLQQLENEAEQHNPDYQRVIRIAIVTARSAPAHERVITTMEEWGVSPDSTFFLGGVPKHRILSQLQPHIFFDDQRSHLESPAGDLPMVHIPFGITNVKSHPG